MGSRGTWLVDCCRVFCLVEVGVFDGVGKVQDQGKCRPSSKNDEGVGSEVFDDSEAAGDGEDKGQRVQRHPEGVACSGRLYVSRPEPGLHSQGAE